MLESLDWDLQEEIGWRSVLPIHRKWDSIGSEELFNKRNTVKADSTIVVDIWMEHLCEKLNIRWLSGIFLTKIKFEFKESSIPCSTFRSLDKGSPLIKISFLWGGIDALILLVAQLLKISD